MIIATTIPKTSSTAKNGQRVEGKKCFIYRRPACGDITVYSSTLNIKTIITKLPNESKFNCILVMILTEYYY